MSCGFTATTTSSAPRDRLGVDVVAATPCRSRSSVARASLRVVTTISVACASRS